MNTEEWFVWGVVAVMLFLAVVGFLSIGSYAVGGDDNVDNCPPWECSRIIYQEGICYCLHDNGTQMIVEARP